MTKQHIAVAEILPVLLSEQTPELGARLMQRIQAVFSSRGLSEFDTKKEGYPKFSVYLERLHSDIVRIVRLPGKSDVHVYKKTHSSSVHPLQQQSISPPVKQNVVIRSDVWQAFLNPDFSRKRFFNKKLKNITHFIPSQDTNYEVEVAATPELFVEITPIPGSEQLSWMHEFLEGAPINEPEKQVISAQIGEKYSSALNATFMKSLGTHGTLWRNHRIPRVIRHIQSWAEKNNIIFSELCVSGALRSTHIKDGNSRSVMADGFIPTEALAPRQLAHKLLDLMTEEDIAQMVLPTMMNALLFKSRQ
ncbi:hypothetical protein ACLEDY_09255 [Lonsdalea quercina]|uniref:hypothetical protein n=1 Tax=Lonsdalea quercina TaxID=71657 RepID=UPI003976AA52